jgi:hypothetical protein
MLLLVGENVKFWGLRVEEDLEITIHDYLTDPDLQALMKKVPVPPPTTRADEILAACGGMYYSQEAPDMPQFVTEGMHLGKGQPLKHRGATASMISSRWRRLPWWMHRISHRSESCIRPVVKRYL